MAGRLFVSKNRYVMVPVSYYLDFILRRMSALVKCLGWIVLNVKSRVMIANFFQSFLFLADAPVE